MDGQIHFPTSVEKMPAHAHRIGNAPVRAAVAQMVTYDNRAHFRQLGASGFARRKTGRTLG
jgi:hypothetical protein